jgi:rhodanese-related sulfurtransferase
MWRATRRPYRGADGTRGRQTSPIESTVAEITRERLWEKIQAGEELVLVDALSPIAFAGAHLPGAINITPDRVDTLAERRIPDRDAEVVVYCANPDCVSSVEVAARLVELGYTNVLHYAGGKQEWREAGLPLEGGRV